MNKIKVKSHNRKGRLAPLSLNASSWIDDRVENDEPLMFGEFVQFMTDLGYDKKGTVSMGKTMRMLYRIRKERREKEIERSGAYS